MHDNHDNNHDRRKKNSLLQILLERYAYSEIGGTFILI